MKGKDRKLNSRAILFVFILIFQSLPISAQVEIPDSIVRERIQDIQQMLDQGKPNANRWWYGWLAGYSAATVGQGAVYFLSEDRSIRQDMILGTGTTFLGAVGQLITSRVPGYASNRLTQISDSTPENRLKKLYKAEEFLKTGALTEKAGRSWQAHALTGAINVSSGLITWLVFKRTLWAGIENFALNTIITEAQIWTQPTRAMKDYQNYCRKYNSAEKVGTNRSDLNWFVSVYPGGIGIRLVFN